MKFDAVIVNDSDGKRHLTKDALPLRIGTGIDCDIRLPGPGRSAVALLDELDGEPFVQPTSDLAALNINGETLNASRKLNRGDEIEFFGSRIVVDVSAGDMLLNVHLESSAYVTKPPELPDAATAANDETIVATAFRRATEAKPVVVEAKGIRWQSIVAGVVVLLTLVSWLLFSSKSIQFDVQPAGSDELSVEGGWFNLTV